MRVRPHHTAFLENPENERRGAGKGDQFFTLEANEEQEQTLFNDLRQDIAVKKDNYID